MNGSYGEFETLIIKAQEGILSDEDRLLFNDLIKSPENQKIYFEIIKINCALMQLELSESQGINSSFDMDLWQQLASEEKKAHVIKVATPKEPEIFIQKAQRQQRKISKSSSFTLVAAAAAILLIFVFTHFAPPATGLHVAVLSDSMNAKWADMKHPMEKGTPIVTGTESLLLREGYAELLFDNNAQITLEGPVEFQILAEDQIKLCHGRLYATVPQGAIGFTVNTSSARIIDLGTEFGIEANARGDTYLHVIKGKTTLIAGEKSHKVSMEVSKGNAKKVSAATSAISDIPCNTTLFVREINSQYNFVWKGQKQIDLADMVGGGNGFGTGQFNLGINPVTGELGNIKTENRQSKNAYKVIQQNPFVDGVFVPNGNNKQIISSLGHIFEECPVTQGIYFTEIINTPDPLDGQSMTLNGIHYGTDGNTSLFMHANLGITFDLQAIRSQLPGKRVVRFQSRIGISDTTLREFNADFWVLVDGKLRYKKEHVQQKGLLDTLQIELSNTDRFLTLVTTDGGDPDARELPNGFIRRSIDCDWCIFGNPVLILE